MKKNDGKSRRLSGEPARAGARRWCIAAGTLATLALSPAPGAALTMFSITGFGPTVPDLSAPGFAEEVWAQSSGAGVTNGFAVGPLIPGTDLIGYEDVPYVDIAGTLEAVSESPGPAPGPANTAFASSLLDVSQNPASCTTTASAAAPGSSASASCIDPRRAVDGERAILKMRGVRIEVDSPDGSAGGGHFAARDGDELFRVSFAASGLFTSKDDIDIQFANAFGLSSPDVVRALRDAFTLEIVRASAAGPVVSASAVLDEFELELTGSLPADPADSFSFGTTSHASVANPVPEPASSLLAALGIMVATARRRGSRRVDRDG